MNDVNGDFGEPIIEKPRKQLKNADYVRNEHFFVFLNFLNNYEMFKSEGNRALSGSSIQDTFAPYRLIMRTAIDQDH